jgi:glycosyltransferase involved in cell wall biosynthesis
VSRGRREADVVVWAPFAGALYSAEGFAGGAEVQAVTLARSLARSGLRVRHVVASAGGVSRTDDGVEVVELPAGYWRRGLPRRRAVIQTLKDTNAGVYIQRSAGADTGLVALFTRAAGRRSIFSASHDSDFSRDLEMIRKGGGGTENALVRAQYRIGLRSVHAVVAQTRQQAAMAEQNFRRHPVVIPSFAAAVDGVRSSREALLWIGGLSEMKNPLALLEVAARVPEATFWMVAHEVPAERSGLAAVARARAAELPNVEVFGRLPRPDVLALYERAIAVVNTSHHEGFPNTFLEAWSRGVPAVSLRVDPDGVMTRSGSGVLTSGDVDRAADAIRAYVRDADAAEAAGEAGRRYIRETHSPEVVTPQWVSLVERLLDRR